MLNDWLRIIFEIVNKSIKLCNNKQKKLSKSYWAIFGGTKAICKSLGSCVTRQHNTVLVMKIKLATSEIEEEIYLSLNPKIILRFKTLIINIYLSIYMLRWLRVCVEQLLEQFPNSSEAGY